MPLDATANFVRGETDSSTDSIQTTVSVVDASILPDPATQGEYNVVIWDVADYPRPDQDPDVEILRVTAIDTTADDLTVTRGQEGTSGASHPLGSAVHLSPTAKMFGDIEATFNAFYDDANDVLTSQVGTSTNRSDIFGDAVDANSVSTDELLLASPNPTKVIGSRSANTFYQNTTGTDLRVSIEVENDGLGGKIDSQLRFSPDQSTEIVVDRATISGSDTLRYTHQMTVPDGGDYILQTCGTGSPNNGVEYKLG